MTKKKTPPKKVTKAARKPRTVLVVRTVGPDMKSHGGFTWPASGAVACTDWSDEPKCGNGLHGWLWGAGDWSLKNPAADAKWLVVEVEASEIVELGGKVKFPKGNVVGCFGHWRDAMAMIRSRLADITDAPKAIATKEGEYASATGESGHASATGNYGHASATGYYGHASATGESGHASATGNYGWAIAGYAGTAKADKDGALTILWWDDKAKRPRVAVGYVGEGGIEAGVEYQVVNGKLAKV